MRELHGMTGTRLYRAWQGMKHRCYYPKANHYERYGGRGITVCEEWRNSFSAFCEWALNNGYQDNLSLDRINTDGNYEPSNCRWADDETQIINRSNTRYAIIRGQEKSLKEWAEITGINYNTLCTRYVRGARGEELIKGVQAHKTE